MVRTIVSNQIEDCSQRKPNNQIENCSQRELNNQIEDCSRREPNNQREHNNMRMDNKMRTNNNKSINRNTIYILMVALILLLAGCKTKDKMVNFIPTPIPEIEDSVDGGAEYEEELQEEADATPAPKDFLPGQAKTMYVQLDTYGAFLNVRSTPSTNGAKVGFLVHAEKVEVVGIDDGWASIEYDGNICYVSSDFLVDERPTYIPAPTATPVPTKAPVATEEDEAVDAEEPANDGGGEEELPAV